MSQEAEIAKVIQERGWYGVNVYDGNPPFVYSIGVMETWNHPELIVFGLEPRDAGALLASIIHLIRSGERFDSDQVSEVRVGNEIHRVGLRKVHPSKHPLYLGYAMGYCRHMGGSSSDLEAMQVCWPDGKGNFPFEAGFSWEVSDLQPRLDIPLTPKESAEFEREFE